MVDSLYYSSRKIPERCENSFVDYRINYQKLCYLMRQTTKDLNSAIDTCIDRFTKVTLYSDEVNGRGTLRNEGLKFFAPEPRAPEHLPYLNDILIRFVSSMYSSPLTMKINWHKLTLGKFPSNFTADIENRLSSWLSTLWKSTLPSSRHLKQNIYIGMILPQICAYIQHVQCSTKLLNVNVTYTYGTRQLTAIDCSSNVCERVIRNSIFKMY